MRSGCRITRIVCSHAEGRGFRDGACFKNKNATEWELSRISVNLCALPDYALRLMQFRSSKDDSSRFVADSSAAPSQMRGS